MVGDVASIGQTSGTLWRVAGPERTRAFLLLILPGIWVGAVLVLEALVPADIQLGPLLAAAPAIACASTGRRQCVVLAGLCAVFALLPISSVQSADTGPGQRIGTFGAILSVVVASYVISRRRLHVLRDLAQVRAIAEVAQRVLLRAPQPRVGEVRVAARYASATAGAVIGGDFYEVVDTPFGVRAVIGDVRGSGLGAVESASVLLGSFREAAYDEPDLREVARRLDVSLRRHLGAEPWRLGAQEDFASVALVSIRMDARLELLNCGHPTPYLIRSGSATPLAPDVACLPLGLAGLAAPGADRREVTVAPFHSGDSVLLFTDGVTEARDAVGGFFALDRSLCRLAEAEPASLVSGIHSDVVAHTGGARSDDLALLLLRRA